MNLCVHAKYQRPRSYFLNYQLRKCSPVHTYKHTHTNTQTDGHPIFSVFCKISTVKMVFNKDNIKNVNIN